MEKKIDLQKEEVILFLVGIIYGFIVHGFRILNKFPNSDDILNLVSDNDMLETGRWFLKDLSAISGAVSIPWVIGTISVIAIAVIACMIIRVLDIQNRVHKIVIVMLLHTFPSVSAIFAYMFTADAYFIGMILAVLGVYIIVKCNKKWMVIGILCMTCAVGTYQANIGLSIGLFAIIIIMQFLQTDKDLKKTVIEALYYVMCVGVALLIYYVVLKVLLDRHQVELGAYQGVGNVNVLSILKALSANILSAYIEFIQYFMSRPIQKQEYLQFGAYIILLVTALYQMISLVVSKKIYKEKGRLFLIILIVAMLPLGFNSIHLFTGIETYVHQLMIYPIVLTFVFGIKLNEEYIVQKSAVKLRKIVGMIVMASLFIINHKEYIFTNEVYLAQNLTYERTYAQAIGLAHRISMVDDYTTQTPVMIVGDFDVEALYVNPNMKYIHDLSIVGHLTTRFNYTLKSFIQDYLGVALPNVEAQKKVEILESDAFRLMEQYPNDGSIQMIEDTIVVKLGTEEIVQ